MSLINRGNVSKMNILLKNKESRSPANLLKALFIVLLLSFNSSLFAQLQVSTNGTVAQWVQNVLVGQGVVVSNVTYTGDTNSIGLFTTGTTTGNLGINSGIVLSTGNISDMPGSATYNASTATSGGSDPQLANLITQTINDAAVLEFDFISIGDTVKFNFVFGSEEYPEYVSSYNDVFGFFISGFKPGGGMYSSQNIALVPGLVNTPVSIYNVNNGSTNTGPCVNCAYYVNNANGTFVRMDGMTTVLTAKAAVYPCMPYHIKIAIGDAGDQVYDSGVFLQAGSFSSNSITISQSTSSAIDTIAVEGCVDAVVSFTLADTTAVTRTLMLTYSGTAQNGVDYSTLPGSVVIPVGQISTTLNVHPILDYLNEPLEYLDIRVKTSACTYDTVRVYIKNSTHTELRLPNDTMVCSRDTVVIHSFPSEGYAPYSYLWSTGDTLDSLIIVPTSDTVYKLTVTDLCGNDTIDSLTILVSEPIYQSFGDTVCKGDSAHIGIIPSDNYTYSWTTGASTQNVSILPTSSGIYIVTVMDSLFCMRADTIEVIVNPVPVFTISPDTVICNGDSSLLKGYGNYSFLWSNGVNNYKNTVKPNTTTVYKVIVADVLGCIDSAEVEVEVLPSPTAKIYVPFDTICKGKAVILEGSGGDQYFWSNGGMSQNISVNPMINTSYTLQVSNTSGATHCYDDTTITLIVERCNFIYVPSAFTPNSDGLNDQFGADGQFVTISSYQMIIFNRWGQEMFSTNSPLEKWDGSYQGQDAPVGVYTYIITVEELMMEPYTLRGTVHLYR